MHSGGLHFAITVAKDGMCNLSAYAPSRTWCCAQTHLVNGMHALLDVLACRGSFDGMDCQIEEHQGGEPIRQGASPLQCAKPVLLEAAPCGHEPASYE